jgi:hypothetical protein
MRKGRLFANNGPFKFRIFWANAEKGGGHVRVAVNISTIEVAKTEKTLGMHVARLLPFGDSFNLGI